MKTESHPLLKTTYGLAAAVALFTGFGNMPLYGRYYVANVPGMGWSGNFFINVNVHILAGSLLSAIGVYALTTALMPGRLPVGRLTLSGKIRGVLLAFVLLTGMVMVIKNLPGVHFPLEVLMTSNFTHMGAAILFMITAMIALIFRQPWRRIG